MRSFCLSLLAITLPIMGMAQAIVGPISGTLPYYGGKNHAEATDRAQRRAGVSVQSCNLCHGAPDSKKLTDPPPAHVGNAEGESFATRVAMQEMPDADAGTYVVMQKNVIVSQRCALLRIKDCGSLERDLVDEMAQKKLEYAGHQVVDFRYLPSNSSQITQTLMNWASQGISLIVVLGGCELTQSPDVVDQVMRLITPMPNFSSLMAKFIWDLWSPTGLGYLAMRYQAVGGFFGTTMIYNIPACTDTVQVAFDWLIIPDLNLRHLQSVEAAS